MNEAEYQDDKTVDSEEISSTETEPKGQEGVSESDKQVAAWEYKIKTGKAKLEDIPEKQSWIRERLETPKAELDIDAIVEKKLQEREQKSLYSQLQESLNSLDADTQEKIKAEEADLVSSGLTKSKALEKSIAWVLSANEQAKLAARRRSMAVPKAGHYGDNEGRKSLDNWETLNDDDLVGLAQNNKSYGPPR